jgi:hypothetical protein
MELRPSLKLVNRRQRTDVVLLKSSARVRTRATLKDSTPLRESSADRHVKDKALAYGRATDPD